MLNTFVEIKNMKTEMNFGCYIVRRNTENQITLSIKKNINWNELSFEEQPILNGNEYEVANYLKKMGF